ncbi:MAG TPA: nuclease [Edaphobacter sp.]
MKAKIFGVSHLSFLLLCLPLATAQQPIGTVGVQDATVAGALEVTNGRAVLVGNTTVTAREHTAEIALNRGGKVRVCSTSGLHVTAGKGGATAPLMLALDRGAIEVMMPATTSDVVMTPDLRFTMRSEGPLDLHLRVARNGDTCVENRGEKAPMLGVADQFGEATYELHPGQHVLFERGSLKEVVDHESSACGCPPEPVISVADAGATGGTPATPGSPVAAKSAEEQHPFPAAVSAGLAPASSVPQAPAGVVHAQVSTTLSYGAGDGSGTNASTAGDAGIGNGSSVKTPAAAPVSPPAIATPDSPQIAGTAQAPPPPPAPSAPNIFHSIGHFFKHLFGKD